ncbi:MAG: decaprenyl-phosphate phosphoribosyltransferase [bacterium]
MIKAYLKLIRSPQWIKNLFIFVPLLFAKKLFFNSDFLIVFAAFVQFCLAASIIYIINDIIDIEADKIHPVKKLRPIASGIISKSKASLLIGLLVLLSIPGLFYFNVYFIGLLIFYILLNIAYSLKLKHLVILDLLSLASGFVIRVVAGALVISVAISNWLILATLFVSIFLAVIKRRSELAVIAESDKTRKVLKQYSLNYLDQLTTISATGLIVCYALYSVSEQTIQKFHTESLVFTIIFVVYGVFRYMYLMHNKNIGENPTDSIIKDSGMIVNLICYILVIVYIIYF